MVAPACIAGSFLRSRRDVNSALCENFPEAAESSDSLLASINDIASLGQTQGTQSWRWEQAAALRPLSLRSTFWARQHENGSDINGKLDRGRGRPGRAGNFHNAETGFCVVRVKARGQRDPVTVIGHTAMISAGEFVQASGSWVNDRTHGLQFRATFVKATAPTTVEGIEKYLGSGMIRGIGPVYAKKLVRAFGAAVFDLIEQDPRRLREVTGIGPKRAARITAGWAEQKVIREIMLFLHSNGVGTSRAVRIY
jgi:ATP-dependent exoDNAse (exonuclease V) alpha subunit